MLNFLYGNSKKKRKSLYVLQFRIIMNIYNLLKKINNEKQCIQNTNFFNFFENVFSNYNNSNIDFSTTHKIIQNNFPYAKFLISQRLSLISATKLHKCQLEPISQSRQIARSSATILESIAIRIETIYGFTTHYLKHRE